MDEKDVSSCALTILCRYGRRHRGGRRGLVLARSCSLALGKPGDQLVVCAHAKVLKASMAACTMVRG